MIRKVILGVVAAVVVYLLCVLVGDLLVALNVAIAVTIGTFLKNFAGVLSVLAFLYWTFVGAVPTL